MMKYRIKRNETPKETNFVIIYIGKERFRLTESIDGKLTINKISDGISDTIKISPRVSNEIDVF